MYHGIIIDKQFISPTIVEDFKTFAKKIDGSWAIYGIEVEDKEIESTMKKIQKETRPNEPWYAHFYNDENLYVVFKEKIFKVKPHKSSWNEIIEYGKTLNIPEEQLTFWPNRFQDERHYF